MCWVCHTVKAQQKHPCTSAASLIGSYFQIIVRVCYAAFLMQRKCKVSAMELAQHCRAAAFLMQRKCKVSAMELAQHCRAAAFLMQSYVIYLKRGIPLPVFCVFLCNMGI